MENYVYRLQRKKWGVFNHYLSGWFLNSESDRNLNLGTPASWDECVKRFDVEKLAYSLHKMGAGYYFITLMQSKEYMLAPNAVYDKIAGTEPGQVCATRDLPSELYDALSKYDIDLCLYFTGDGPMEAPFAKKFGFTKGDTHITEEFVENWTRVLEEYSVRYGEKVKAWWFDGMYDHYGYNNKLFKMYHDAVHKGNPYAATAFNNGMDLRFAKHYESEEFCAGELNYFGPTPRKKEREATVPHILTPIGYQPGGEEWMGWSKGGIKYTKEYAVDYINTIYKLGGFTTLDILVNVDGSFDPEQEAFLRNIGKCL